MTTDAIFRRKCCQQYKKISFLHKVNIHKYKTIVKTQHNFLYDPKQIGVKSVLFQIILFIYWRLKTQKYLTIFKICVLFNTYTGTTVNLEDFSVFKFT